MSDDRKDNKLKKYLGTALLGLIASFAVMSLAGLWRAENAADAASAVCDGFFTVGILMLAGGGMSFIANNGLFDIIGYGVSLVLSVMSLGKYEKKYDTYYDYKQSRKTREIMYIIIVGAIYLLLSLAALAVFIAVE